LNILQRDMKIEQFIVLMLLRSFCSTDFPKFIGWIDATG
jgi:hypothetical protein